MALAANAGDVAPTDAGQEHGRERGQQERAVAPPGEGQRRAGDGHVEDQPDGPGARADGAGAGGSCGRPSGGRGRRRPPRGPSLGVRVRRGQRQRDDERHPAEERRPGVDPADVERAEQRPDGGRAWSAAASTWRGRFVDRDAGGARSGASTRDGSGPGSTLVYRAGGPPTQGPVRRYDPPVVLLVCASPGASAPANRRSRACSRPGAPTFSTPTPSPARSSSPARRRSGQLVERFGPGILTADGSLDRPKLAELARFASDEERKALEGITHPAINAEFMRRMGEAPPDGIVVMDVPFLVEAGPADVRVRGRGRGPE